MFRAIVLWLSVVSIGYCHVLMIFDFDNVIVESRKLRNNSRAIGSWQTPHILKRRDAVISDLAVDRETLNSRPRTLTVNSHDFEDLVDMLHRPGEFPQQDGRTPFTLSSGEVIIPDHYQMTSETFDYFREATDGSNHLIETFKAAIARKKDSGVPWEGPYFDHLVKAMELKAKGENVQIVINTARGHSKEEWDQFFDLLMKEVRKEKKGLRLSKPDLFLGMSHADTLAMEALGPSLETNIDKRKSEIAKELILELDKVPFKPFATKDLDMDNPNSLKDLHSVVIFDDSQSNIKSYYKTLRPLLTEKILNRTKISLVNAGLKTEVRESEFPKAFVLQSDGTTRKIIGDEIMGGFPGLGGHSGESCLYSLDGILKGRK